MFFGVCSYTHTPKHCLFHSSACLQQAKSCNAIVLRLLQVCVHCASVSRACSAKKTANLSAAMHTGPKERRGAFDEIALARNHTQRKKDSPCVKCKGSERTLRHDVDCLRFNQNACYPGFVVVSFVALQGIRGDRRDISGTHDTTNDDDDGARLHVGDGIY